VLSAVLKAQRIVVDDRSRNKARARDVRAHAWGSRQ
jgi:hypothetical protein